LKALFDRLDRNGDGVLEFGEFVAIGRIFQSGRPGGHLAMGQGPQSGPAGPGPMMHRRGPGGPPMGPHAQPGPGTNRAKIKKAKPHSEKVKSPGDEGAKKLPEKTEKK
jgi:hypothetical protein